MSLTVEDGSGYPNSDAYVSVEDCFTYSNNWGLGFTDIDFSAAEAAIRRATRYIEATYRLRFSGVRTNRDTQALEWPRTAAYYYRPEQGPSPFYVYALGYFPFTPIPINVVPPEVVNATCEAAARELLTPNILRPDLKRGGLIASVKAGTVDVKYGSGAGANTVFQAIDMALSGLLLPTSLYSGKASRG